MPHSLTLEIHPGRLAICRLEAGSPVPDWALQGEFSSITRTSAELSIVCGEGLAPATVRADRGWRVLRVVGTQDLTLVGVLASLVEPIARAGVNLFSVSTFDTDYLLVPGEKLATVVAALTAAGHSVADPSAAP